MLQRVTANSNVAAFVMHLLHQSCSEETWRARSLQSKPGPQPCAMPSRVAAHATPPRRPRHATQSWKAQPSGESFCKSESYSYVFSCVFRFQADFSLPFHTWQGWAPCVPPGAELPPRSLHVRLLSKCMERRLCEVFLCAPYFRLKMKSDCQSFAADCTERRTSIYQIRRCLKFRCRGREQEAVDEAQQMRSEQSARTAEQCEAGF